MDKIQEALQKALIQQKQLQLQVQFNQNIEVFEKVAPAIAAEYRNYQPQNLALRIDSNQCVNLMNLHSGRFVYAENPEDFAAKQLEQFKNVPLVSIIHFNKTINNSNFFHVEYTNELIDINSQYRAPRSSLTKQSPIGLLLVCGCGMGYHLPALVEQLDIHNMNIFDPHKDSFFASLHTINWAPIIQHFTAPGRSLRLSIGVNNADAMTNLKFQGVEIGLHNMACTFIYNHFNSPDIETFIDLYKKEYHLTATGVGFFEDEQISLAHTVVNLKQHRPLLTAKPPINDLPPVFIIGNGPSLDTLAPFLREHQDNAILFSCGTALGALHKLGIKPDFHIEMERQRIRADWVEGDTDAEFRHGVSLIALNTVSPHTFELFDHSYMVAKANDLGAIVMGLATDIQSPPAQMCNPTVTNMGMSVAVLLGFKEAYLLGVDFGMRAKESHHSQHSSYNALDEKTTTELNKHLEESGYKIAGNFGGEVWTTFILDDARRNMELLLKTFPQVTAFNLNDGARINNAISQPVEGVTLNNQFDKAKVIEQLQQQFAVPGKALNEKTIRQRYLSTLDSLKQQLMPPATISSGADLFAYMDNLYAKVNALTQEAPVAASCLRGTLNTLFSLTAVYAFYNDAQIQVAYPRIRELYQSYIDDIYSFVDGDMFRLDANRADYLVNSQSAAAATAAKTE